MQHIRNGEWPIPKQSFNIQTNFSSHIDPSQIIKIKARSAPNNQTGSERESRKALADRISSATSNHFIIIANHFD